MNAVAISNNDMVYLHWHVDDKIDKCLGFNIIRHDAKTGKGQPLPAMVGFPGDRKGGKEFKSTDVWPVQKYAWKDVFAPRGGTYWYEIVPMTGEPGKLKPDLAGAMRTNSVTLSPEHGACSVYFNRGIISTQAVAESLPKGSNGLPSGSKLKEKIKNPKDSLRARLMGDLEGGVLKLLQRAKDEGGVCYCALYELDDQDLIEHLRGMGKKVHIVLSNAGGTGQADSTNADARNALRGDKVDVTDRILDQGKHIGHNKFIVYVKNGKPRAVLSGSTNWTSTGLCAQSNNAVIVESPELAADYLDYWNRLKKDTEDAGGEAKQLQGPAFRTANKVEHSTHPLTDGDGKPAGDVRVWFSPNTRQTAVPRGRKAGGQAGGKAGKPNPPPEPADLKEVFGLIEEAKQGVLFLAFIPGNPSIVSKLKEVYDQRRRAKKLFYVRGAATSPDPAGQFRVDLFHRTARPDASVRAVPNPPDAPRANAEVASVAGIFAAFAQWEAEIYQVGHAVIHDKIVVIDPFTDDSVVVTGSHNLGFKASYANDENMLVIRGNRPVAHAYAAHVLDVYEHYRWRWRIQQPIRDRFAKLKEQNPDAKGPEVGKLWQQSVKEVGPVVIKNAWQELKPNDTWQDYYQQDDVKRSLAAEANFWSAFGGVGMIDE